MKNYFYNNINYFLVFWNNFKTNFNEKNLEENSLNIQEVFKFLTLKCFFYSMELFEEIDSGIKLKKWYKIFDNLTSIIKDDIF